MAYPKYYVSSEVKQILSVSGVTFYRLMSRHFDHPGLIKLWGPMRLYRRDLVNKIAKERQRAGKLGGFVERMAKFGAAADLGQFRPTWEIAFQEGVSVRAIQDDCNSGRRKCIRFESPKGKTVIYLVDKQEESQ